MSTVMHISYVGDAQVIGSGVGYARLVGLVLHRPAWWFNESGAQGMEM
jgi:hypothetical protein